MSTIDYVKLTSSREVFATDMEWWEELAEQCVELQSIEGKFYDKTSVFSRLPPKGWRSFFSIWGYPAHLFFYRLAGSELAETTRLDVKEILEVSPNYELLYKIAKQRNKHGRSIQQISSRPRKKNGGRDTGGEGFIIGAKGAPRRLSVIKRGEEVDYVELEVCLSALANCRQEAMNTFASDSKGCSYHIHLADALHALLARTCREWLGLTLEQLVKGFKGEENTPTEAIIEQVDWLIDQLDEPDYRFLVNTLYSDLQGASDE